MKIAYLILAHDNPRHLRRLIRALTSASSKFFVHIDGKSDMRDFSGIDADNLSFSEKRIAVYWGDFSQVEATLVLIRQALADPCRFDRLVLLSGTDYPLHSPSHIESFFDRNRASEFMDLVQMPSESAGKPISRLTQFKPRPYQPVMARITRKALELIGAIPRERDYRKYLGTLIPYAGSVWWALSGDACGMIQTFADKELAMVNFFKNTHCPDEMFFQTVLGNSPFGSRMVQSLTYTDWSAGGSRPAYITEKHLDFFQTTSSIDLDGAYGGGEILFARKFTDDSEGLVTRLEKLIVDKDGQLG